MRRGARTRLTARARGITELDSVSTRDFSLPLLSVLSLLAACDGSLSGSGGGGAAGGDGGGAGEGGSAAGGSPPLPPVVCEHVGSGTDYEVGPGRPYESLGEVPTETLRGGDTIRLHHRPEPYREKIMLGGQGEEGQPIRLCGIPGPGGELPVIDGSGASTRPESDFPYPGHQARGVVVIGHRNGDPYEEMPGPFVVEGIAVTGGRPTNTFVDVDGQTQSYSEAVGGIFVQRGAGVTIRGCEVYDNANGLFLGTSGGEEGTYDALVEGNAVWGNGTPGSDRQHNVYDEVNRAIYQFNYFGPLHPESFGANVKERSAGLVFRYNFVEGGAHLLDLVDAQEAKAWHVDLPEYHETFVYGNVLRSTGMTGSMIHYGGDSEEYALYRKGTLYFFHNTVFAEVAGQEDYEVQALFELSTNDERAWSRNNVYHASVPPTDYRPVVLLGGRDGLTSGVFVGAGDWSLRGLTPWKMIPDVMQNFEGDVQGFDPASGNEDPGFVDVPAGDFRPAVGSPLLEAGVPLEPDLEDTWLPVYSYVPHQSAEPRSDVSAPTIGALLP